MLRHRGGLPLRLAEHRAQHPTSTGIDFFSGDVWQDGAPRTIYDESFTPAVQFKASGGS